MGGVFVALVTRREGGRQELWKAEPMASWGGEVLVARRGGVRKVLAGLERW